ncbi:MAG: VanZ family protein [Nanoarchaeota archaeon]|nr:VanZ family protein [Nanoarchaeota archaeon]
MKFIKRQIFYWLPVYVYMVLIFYFSSDVVSGIAGIGGGFNYISYLKHLIEYSILGVLFYRGFFNSKFKKKSFNLSLILASLYGLSDEVHQYFVPGRICSSVDFGVDVVGVVIGILIIRRFYKFLASTKK